MVTKQSFERAVIMLANEAKAKSNNFRQELNPKLLKIINNACRNGDTSVEVYNCTGAPSSINSYAEVVTKNDLRVLRNTGYHVEFVPGRSAMFGLRYYFPYYIISWDEVN